MCGFSYVCSRFQGLWKRACVAEKRDGLAVPSRHSWSGMGAHGCVLVVSRLERVRAGGVK